MCKDCRLVTKTCSTCGGSGRMMGNYICHGCGGSGQVVTVVHGR